MPTSTPPPSHPPRHLPATATPLAFAKAIVAAYASREMNPSHALDAAQITPSKLRKTDGRMTARQMEVLSATAMRELDDEGLGAFTRRLPWGSYGMLARASLSAPTLGVALQRWCRHHGLLVDDIALSVGQSGDSATIQIDEHRTLPAWARELCLVFVLRNIHGLACWYIDSRIALHATSLPFHEPPHAETYNPMFSGGAITFGAAHAQIRFDARYLALPLRRDDKALRQMLQQHALHTTVLPYRRDRLLVQQVRQALAAHPQATHNAEGVAALLHVSVRTLHRQLKDEGASLQQLKDAVRCDSAKELLNRSGKPIKQIAAAVGFDNEKSFSRAFKTWTGVIPSDFRRMGIDLSAQMTPV